MVISHLTPAMRLLLNVNTLEDKNKSLASMDIPEIKPLDAILKLRETSVSDNASLNLVVKLGIDLNKSS